MSPGEARALFARPWTFVKGVVDEAGLPATGWPEVAFAGRSNVGKSTLINALVAQGGLARTSNTPGRTQEINFFQPEAGGGYIVDLPGYGYAAAPRRRVDAWNRLIRDYLRGRATLARLFLLIDARHGIKPNDVDILKLLGEAAVSTQIVLTKLDKLKVAARDKARARVADAARAHVVAHPDILATSALKDLGVADVRAAVYAVLQR